MDLHAAGPSLDIGLSVQAACILEATARKAGNVHRAADFADCCYLDFLLAGAAIAPVMATAAANGVGRTILDAIEATRRVIRCNANLGIVLLLAPLAAIPKEQTIAAGIGPVLQRLTIDDAALAYRAIRLARPGGLGRAPEEDVAHAPTRTLREAMALAADRDLVARQYANSYRDVLSNGVPCLVNSWSSMLWEAAIQRTHLELLALHPDSLIVRKRGQAEADEVSRRAAGVLAAGFPTQPGALAAHDRFDAWLREHGNTRNPGTTADLVTAALFIAIRERRIDLPSLARPADRP